MKFVETDYLEICNFLNISSEKNYRKRVSTFFLGLVFAVAISMFYQVYFGVVIAFISILLYKYEYFALKSKSSQITIQRQISFVNFFSYLLVFLENKLNLYQSIKATEEYLDNDIHLLVQELIENINRDKSTVPYINFARYFSSEIVMQIMLLLHQFEENGYSESQLKRFSITLDKMKENTVDDYICRVNSQLDLFTLVPVIVSVLVTTFFAIGVLENLGGFI